MKFDDKPLNDKTLNDKTLSEQHVSPQSAMDAYFDDMFGSAEEDPLKKLSSQKDAKSTESSNQGVILKISKSNIESSKNIVVPKTYLPKADSSKPKLKPKKLTQQFISPIFDEPEINTNNISPLIIPAAFPKLAPAVTQTEPVKKVIMAPKLKSEIPVPAVTKPKLDAKTALALLEKQKSKLSSTQRLRLEEKLKTLEKKTTIVPVVSDVKVKPAAVTKTVTKAVAKTVVKTVAKTVTKLEVKEPVRVTAKVINKQAETVSIKPSTTQIKVPDLAIQKNSRPDWANNRFECLIFSVAGLKLAVPLISLGAIYKIEKEFIPLVGRANWFMGLYHHLERNVRVIDTAQWVMPERCSAEVRAAYKFIIRLGGNDWGLACDAVHQSIQLRPDQIKWRSERTKRAWLFGTVIDHMCALIDADSLSTMLNQHSNKNPRVFSQ